MYVPFIPKPEPPSQEAQDLAQHVVESVESYRATRPEIGDGDVGVALRLARENLSSGAASANLRMVVAALVGLLAAGLVFLLVAYRGVGGTMMAILALVVVAASMAVVMASKKGL